LHCLDEIESPFEIDKDLEGDGGIILITRLLGLLEIFLGEALTLSLLRNAWPGEVIDNHNSAHGRNT
jgi:predicted membrane protein